MRVIPHLLFLTLVGISCKKTNYDYLIPNGTYSGTFQRQTLTGGQISNVTLVFSADSFSGQSQYVHYPALCHGTYKIVNADSVTFQDDCAWTAEFDWSLIINRGYKIKMEGKTLEITRDYPGAYKDIYELTRQ
jgi:hypothetical protein